MQIETEKRKNVLSYLVRNGKHPPYFRRHHASGHVIVDCAFSVLWDTSTGCHVTIYKDDTIFSGESFPQERESRVGMQICFAQRQRLKKYFLKWNGTIQCHLKTILPHRRSLQTRHAIFVSWRGHFRVLKHTFYNGGKTRISGWPAKGRESRYLPVFLKSVTGLAVPSGPGGYSLIWISGRTARQGMFFLSFFLFQACATLIWRSMRSCGDSLMLDGVLMTVRVRNKVFIYLFLFVFTIFSHLSLVCIPGVLPEKLIPYLTGHCHDIFA